MTDTDPYTGIRTRENIVAAPVEVEAEFSGGGSPFDNFTYVVDDAVPVGEVVAAPESAFDAVRAMIAARNAIIPGPRGGGGGGSGSVTTSGGQGGSGGGGGWTPLRRRMSANSREAMEQMDAEAVLGLAAPSRRQTPPTPPPVVDPARAFELNYVPAEDLPAHERIDQLKVLVENMLHDWRKLNEFFNTTAVNRDWCEEYEERLQRYNESFKVLRMVGRPKNWYGSASNWASTDGDG